MAQTYLPSGRYWLSSRVDDQGYDVVASEDGQIQVSLESPTKTIWEIQKMADADQYSFKISGEPVGNFDGMIKTGGEKTWSLLKDIHYADNSYAIADSADIWNGWVVADPKNGSPIITLPLVAGHSTPPMYPTNQVFFFNPA